MWKILCARSAGRQVKLRNTSSSTVLPCAEEARIWKLSRRREDRANRRFIQDRIRHLVDAFSTRAEVIKEVIKSPATPSSAESRSH
nr:unnamed protein product [Callosobruchus chinensis]